MMQIIYAKIFRPSKKQPCSVFLLGALIFILCCNQVALNYSGVTLVYLVDVVL